MALLSASSPVLDASRLHRASTTIGEEVAARHAAEVDADARFPSETLAALGEAGVLGALVPVRLGGSGLSLTTAGESLAELARHCSSSAMVLAMHHLQVMCLARHGTTTRFERFLSSVAADQLLVASATSERGIGGQLRTSSCAIEPDGNGFRLQKDATVISYGAESDAILVTARRTVDSAPGDQVLALCTPPSLTLERTSEWDSMGLRGTCSSGYLLSATISQDDILTDPFADIAAATMLPVSHVLWSYVWLGLATAAVDRARRYVQGEARKTPGTTPQGANRLAELVVAHLELKRLVGSTGLAVELELAEPGARGGIGTGMNAAIALNSLKISASRAVVDIVTDALRICGMAGYSERSPFSMGRLLRDAHGAALMVSNDRLLADNAQMLLVAKDH